MIILSGTHKKDELELQNTNGDKLLISRDDLANYATLFEVYSALASTKFDEVRVDASGQVVVDVVEYDMVGK